MNSPQAQLLPFRWHHAEKLWLEYKTIFNQKEIQRLDRWLAQQYKKNKNFGKKDRRFYSFIFFQIFRFAPLFVILKKMEESPQLKNSILRDAPEIDGDYYKREFYLKNLIDLEFTFIAQALCLISSELEPQLTLSEELKNNFQLLKSSHEFSDFLFSLIHGFPVYFLEELLLRSEKQKWTKKEFRGFIRNHSQKPPLWIRVCKKTNFNKITNDLNQNNIEYKVGGDDENSLLLKDESQIKNLKSFLEGDIEIQDLASQKTIELIKWGELKNKNLKIWDICAGGGGKAIQLAQLEERDIEIFASDIREHKIHEAQKRAEKSGLENIVFFPFDFMDKENIPDFLNKNLPMDMVFVDAPCSGSGTWRRSPDQALFLTQEQLNYFINLQAEILENCSTVVKKNGLLIYITCSFLEFENEKMVESFLLKNKNFQLLGTQFIGNPFFDSDAMFLAQLRKIK